MDEAQLDAQVSQVMAEMQAAGEHPTAEGVARRVKRRTTDVLDAIRRVTEIGTAVPDADTPPEAYPAVEAAATRVAQLTAAVAAAAADAQAAERVCLQAEAATADAMADDQVSPIDIADARQRALAAAEREHLLGIALQKAKARHAETLDGARRAHKIQLWGAYQSAVKAMIETGDAFALAQEEVLGRWNRLDQPGETPYFRGTVQTWREDFRRHLESIVNTPFDEAPLSGGLPYGTVPQPHAYQERAMSDRESQLTLLVRTDKDG